MVNDAIKPPLVALYRGYKGLNSRRRDFNRWRAGRPFVGGALLVAAGLVAGFTPFQVLQNWLFRDGSAQIIGILGSFFAVAVIMAGLGVMLNPELSNLLGMIGITFTILVTLVGNFGGLLVGTFLGIIGGAMCIAWRRTDIPARRAGVPHGQRGRPRDDRRSGRGGRAEDRRGRGERPPPPPQDETETAAERAAQEVRDAPETEQERVRDATEDDGGTRG
jgi:hypothetical protein